MNKNNINSILIFSIVILFVLTGGMFLMVTVIKNKNNHTSAVLATLNQKMVEKENLNILEKRMSELGNTRNKIEGYLVDPAGIDTFVEYLEKTGAGNGVDLSVKSVEIPKMENNKISASLYMVGSFNDILKVISLLENAPYDIVITSTYLSKQTLSEIALSNISGVSKEKNVAKKTNWQASVTFNVLSK